MNINILTKRNILHYAKYYRLIAFAAIVMVTIITGSLLVGKSVRSTLIHRVEERLGNTETVIFSYNSFIDTEMLKNSLLYDARAILLSKGFISVSERLIPVMVWGVNDKFIQKGEAKLNQALADELSDNFGDFALRLPATGLIPSGSLFVTDNYTVSLRLKYAGTLDTKDGGNISLKNEQIIPFNIFVNQSELSEILEIDNKINLILLKNRISAEELKKVWNYKHSGMKIYENENFTEVVSDRIFMKSEAVETLRKNNPESNRLFSYMVNSIDFKNGSIPYSFAVAMDKYKGKKLKNNEIIVSDYTANRLGLKSGDSVCISYFVSEDLKTLKTKNHSFTVSEIAPLSELQSDSTLSADFPGLSNVERCTDWDSDLPINMDLITDEDENYWNLYRTVPKAVIPYGAVEDDWSNVYGSATAVRINSSKINLSDLSPEMFGIQIIYPKDAGFEAAKNGMDFSGLFLALGIFIVISAVLLMTVPFSEMIYRRQSEISIYKSLGYRAKHISAILRRESFPVVLGASVIGVFFGIIYTYMILFLLGNVWKGATHSSKFMLSLDLETLVSGLFVGVLISEFIMFVITRPAKFHKNKMLTALKTKRKTHIPVILQKSAMLLMLALIICFPVISQSATGFVISGIATIAFAALCGNYFLNRIKLNNFKNKYLNHNRLVWTTLYTNKKQVNLSFYTLAAGVFIVFSVGLNRQNFTDSATILTGTGGFNLWCECSVPVYHNINTKYGRDKLALSDLPENVEIMQILKFGADDASCLNLNKVTKPAVLGIDMNVLSESGFELASVIYSGDKTHVFNSLQNCEKSIYPALVDETVLMWNLGLKLGDTIVYDGENGKKIILQLAGTLKNSIFQGNLLIDRKLFSTAWSEITGSEIILVKTPENKISETKMLISQALSNYGAKVSTTAARLKEFNSVTDTYLSIFMTLGGLGLLLGLMSFIIVVRKSLIARKNEIALYRVTGFTDKKIGKILYKENIIVPLYAIGTGIAASLLCTGINFTNINFGLWLFTVIFTILLVFSILWFVKLSVFETLKNVPYIVR